MNKYRIFPVAILSSFIFIAPLFAQDYGFVSDELFNLGRSFLIDGRYNEARHEFRKYILLNPQDMLAKELLDLCEEKILREQDKDAAATDAPEATPEASQTLTERDKIILSALEKKEKELESAKEAQAPKEIPQEQEANLLQEESEEIQTVNQEKPSTQEESLAPPLQRGAWTLKKGQFYAELYTKYFWNNSQFDGKRKKSRWASNGKGNEIRTELKLEYGLTDKYNLLFSTVAKEAHWKDEFQSATRKGFTEITPGIKYLLFEEPFICSLQGKLKLPLKYPEHTTPSLGSRQIDIEARILSAWPLPKLPGYAKFETGFKGRFQEEANEIPYFFEFGYNLTDNLILKTTLDGKKAIAQKGQTVEDLIKYTFGPIVKLKDLFNLEFGWGQTFYGRNTSAGKEIYVTVSDQW